MNITDTGLGVSQVLPIALQIWLATTHKRRRRRLRRQRLVSTFAIEQPELHLHPRLQSKVAEVILASLGETKRGKNNSFFIETHSEAVISAAGYAVQKQNVSPEDIQILVCEHDPVKGTNIRRSYFNEDGTLSNWPYGFLAP